MRLRFETMSGGVYEVDSEEGVRKVGTSNPDSLVAPFPWRPIVETLARQWPLDPAAKPSEWEEVALENIQEGDQLFFRHSFHLGDTTRTSPVDRIEVLS